METEKSFSGEEAEKDFCGRLFFLAAIFPFSNEKAWHRNLCCGVFLSRRSSALILKTVQNSTQAPTEVCRGFLHIKR